MDGLVLSWVLRERKLWDFQLIIVQKEIGNKKATLVYWKRYIRITFPLIMNIKEQKSYILEAGFESIISKGIRSFTVEALAKRLGMSKKTIYKYFPSKEKLTRKIIHFIFYQIDAGFEKVMANEPNPAVQYIKIMEHISNIAGRIPARRMLEFKTSYPKIWREIESFRLGHQEKFYTILNAAQDQGLARAELNMKTAAVVYINVVNSTFQPEFFLKNDLPIKETIRSFVQVVARGIFTPKGLKAIQIYHEENSI